MEFVDYERFQGYCQIIINNPKQLNALNDRVCTDLNEAFTLAENDPEIRAVILSGAGGKAFVAGADVSAMRNMTAAEAQEFSTAGHKLMERIDLMHKLVIAAVDGFALGGGCELAMACDIRYCSEKSKFALPEINFGIIPGFGGTQRLTRLVGKAQALRLIMSGDQINAEEALRIGLVDHVAASEELLNDAFALAGKLSTNPRFAFAQAVKAVKCANDLNSEGYACEAALFSECFATYDQKEGMTAFLEKRKAEFRGN
jgi:enoyl-CoA hydratase